MKISPLLLLAALLALAFTLATGLMSRAESWGQRTQSDNVFGMMFGDGRKLFANQFFTMADVYFHSGYYPSIFDKKSDEPKAIVSASQGHDDHDHEDGDECEKNGSFLGQPMDWIDAFGRNFKITQHTHLEGRKEREILPWLRLAADLDPQKIETYTVGAFFLREKLNKPDQAEAFLREGLRNNPDSCEILFELGRVYKENLKDYDRARNVWRLGVNKFSRLSPEQQKENKLVLEQLQVNLARLEEEAGNHAEAIKWFKAAQKLSPSPESLQKQIDDIQKKAKSLDELLVPKLY